MASPPRSLSLPSTTHGPNKAMQRTGSLPCTGSLRTSQYGQYLKPCSSLDDLDEHYAESSPSPGSAESLPDGGFFTKLKRRLSSRRKNKNRRDRKGSEDLFLGVLFNNDVGRRLSNSSRDSLPKEFKNENIYRGLLRGLLHPLGIPDKSPGLRPGDLIDHLREIFEVDRDEHEYFIREELVHRPKHVQVKVSIIEGQGLAWSGEKKGDFYCLARIVHHGKKSPKISPKNSPKLSPRMTHSSGSFDEADISKTLTVKNCSNPQWNEEFSLNIDNFFTDEIKIYIRDQTVEQEALGHHVDRHHHEHKFKSLLRMIWHSSEHDKSKCGCFGMISINVKDVVAQGVDKWFDVTECGNKNVVVAKCRIKINLCHRQDDIMSEEYFSIDDYYQAAQQVYSYAAKRCLQDDMPMEGKIQPQDRRVLNTFASSHQISDLSQAIIHVIILLEWTTENDNLSHTQHALVKHIQELQMTWVTKQFNISTATQKMPLTDAEIGWYRKAAAGYIKCISDHLEELPELFPPSVDNVNLLKAKLGVTVQLLELDLWESKSSPHKDLAHLLLHKLQSDVDTYTHNKVETISMHDLVKDPVIPELNILGEIVDNLSSHCYPMGVVRTFYNSIGINFYRIVSLSAEKNISTKTRELMIELDKYQRRYHKFSVNITESSKLALRIYFLVRKFYNITRDNISRRDVFRLAISNYQQWFQETLVFWIQTFRTECMTRIEKALEIDKDVVLVTSRCKFSNSSVDVLACFAKITEEWKAIDFHDPDSSLMGVTKITDLICDGARLYVQKIQNILERNCYYDDEEKTFNVTDRLCITLNNIEHVRQYLNELPQLLEWETVVSRISSTHENDRIGTQAHSTLARLLSTTNKEIIMKSSLLLTQITEKMKVDMAAYMDIFTRKRPEKASSVDKLIGYMSVNLKTLHDKMMTPTYYRMIEHLWPTMVTLLDQKMLSGERPEYYYQMKQHVKALISYFVRGGLLERQVNNPVFEALKTRLDYNTMSTEDLLLAYYDNIADDMGTPLEYFGHLALKFAYIEETRGNITIYVKVIRGCDLPGLDVTGLSDPYVILSLHPSTMFGHVKPQRTRIVEQTLNPVFNTSFQFPNVPRDYIDIQGAVVLLSVFDYDKIGNDDFAGEVLIRLSSIPKISMSQTVDSASVVMMALQRPSASLEGPFQVLVERKSWDKTAKTFLADRKRYLEHHRPRTDRPSKLTNLFSFLTGDKT
ncbi:protein unc-13 homolog D-like isoform X1 [Mytilus galloprovincialis]|uniref:protein unc-13 homolog D-like isoform X1 n=1 Tax=Mytilus galloprovincialis TaxID=29158 RepID=UPI003F7C74CF